MDLYFVRYEGKRGRGNRSLSEWIIFLLVCNMDIHIQRERERERERVRERVRERGVRESDRG
jgi:hypothetical protein